MLAAASGDYAGARPNLEDAVDGFEDCRAAYEAARARVALASTLANLGREVRAREEMELAREKFREIGALADLERVERLAAELDDHRDASANGLSSREAEVLTLLADGLTNRQIGARLHISEHTVHRHVTSILRKLHLTSRTAAAAHAVRAGMVANRRP